MAEWKKIDDTKAEQTNVAVVSKQDLLNAKAQMEDRIAEIEKALAVFK